jgi:hypothetical protein
VIDGTALPASTANAAMQLARPAVGYGVPESTVESGQVMRYPFSSAHPMIAWIDRHHSREYHQTYKNRSARGKNAIGVKTPGIYWHAILRNPCRLNGDGQAKRP